MSAALELMHSALRALRRDTGFTLAATGILAVGLALTLYMFGALDAYLLQPLPFPDAERIVHLDLRQAKGGGGIGLTIADLYAWEEQSHGLGNVAGFSQGTVNLGGDGHPERFEGTYTTAGLAALLGVQPALGRWFETADEQAGAPVAVVLSDTLWRQRYGGDPAVLGRPIRANGRPATIVGVMPPDFRFPFRETVWLPIAGRGAAPEVAAQLFVRGLGRLAAGVTVGAAREELAAIFARRHAADADRSAVGVPRVMPLAERFVGPRTRMTLYTAFAAVLLVLAIACANVANLILARGLTRRRELALRGALGASRRRLVGQVIGECLVVAGLATAVGLWLAELGGRWTIAALRTVEDTPYWIDYRLDLRTGLFAGAIAALAALAAGLWPALAASRFDALGELRQGGRGAVGNALGRTSHLLVAGQIALTCALLVSAVLLARSLGALGRADLGVDPEKFLTGRVGLFEASYPDDGTRVAFFDRLAARLAQLPGIEAATVAGSLPGTVVGGDFYRLDGAADTAEDELPRAHVASVQPSYFPTFEVPLLAGRNFAASDSAAAQPVAIVNRRFAERAWPRQDPLGQRLRLGRGKDLSPWLTVVGIAPDLQQNEVDELIEPTVYRPLAQAPIRFAGLAVRVAAGDPRLHSEAVRRAVAELDPELPVYWLRTLAEWNAENSFITRFLASLFGLFALGGLLLAAVGLYAVLAYAVAQRRGEIGVRRALGAESVRIVRLVLGSSARQLALGLGAGLALAGGFAKLIEGELFGVTAWDPPSYLVVALVLAFVTLTASLLPLFHALAVDPAVVLRDE